MFVTNEDSQRQESSLSVCASIGKNRNVKNKGSPLTICSVLPTHFKWFLSPFGCWCLNAHVDTCPVCPCSHVLVFCSVKQFLALGGSQLPLLLCAGIFPCCVAAFRVPSSRGKRAWQMLSPAPGCHHAVPFLSLAGMMGWPLSGLPSISAKFQNLS